MVLLVSEDEISGHSENALLTKEIHLLGGSMGYKGEISDTASISRRTEYAFRNKPRNGIKTTTATPHTRPANHPWDNPRYRWGVPMR
jgi:hypothetical protein